MPRRAACPPIRPAPSRPSAGRSGTARRACPATTTGLELHQHRSRSVDAAQLLVRQLARDGDRHRQQLRGQDGGYRNLQAQQGIDQAFLTLNFPDVLGDIGTLTWNIGTFQNRYGTMGQYDGGMYETYIFGRTHITRRDADRQPDQPRQRRQLAAHAGARRRRQIRHHPVPQQPELPDLQQRPASGIDQGPPYLADHERRLPALRGLGAPGLDVRAPRARRSRSIRRPGRSALHYLYTWTPDDNWNPINSRLVNASNAVPRALGPIQGSIAVVGGEVRFAGGVYRRRLPRVFAHRRAQHQRPRGIAGDGSLAERLQLQAELLRPDLRRPHRRLSGPAERDRDGRQHRLPVLRSASARWRATRRTGGATVPTWC